MGGSGGRCPSLCGADRYQGYQQKERESNRGPIMILGGFACLFGGLLAYQKKSGASMSYAFGEARVKAQGAALCSLIGFGLYMGATDQYKEQKRHTGLE